MRPGKWMSRLPWRALNRRDDVARMMAVPAATHGIDVDGDGAVAEVADPMTDGDLCGPSLGGSVRDDEEHRGGRRGDDDRCDPTSAVDARTSCQAGGRHPAETRHVPSPVRGFPRRLDTALRERARAKVAKTKITVNAAQEAYPDAVKAAWLPPRARIGRMTGTPDGRTSWWLGPTGRNARRGSSSGRMCSSPPADAHRVGIHGGTSRSAG